LVWSPARALRNDRAKCPCKGRPRALSARSGRLCRRWFICRAVNKQAAKSLQSRVTPAAGESALVLLQDAPRGRDTKSECSLSVLAFRERGEGERREAAPGRETHTIRCCQPTATNTNTDTEMLSLHRVTMSELQPPIPQAKKPRNRVASWHRHLSSSGSPPFRPAYALFPAHSIRPFERTAAARSCAAQIMAGKEGTRSRNGVFVEAAGRCRRAAGVESPALSEEARTAQGRQGGGTGNDLQYCAEFCFSYHLQLPQNKSMNAKDPTP
jgi:hypothetical protein